MQILTDKQLVNLNTPRLLEVKRKLNTIVGTRKHRLEEDMKRGEVSEADYELLREYEEFYGRVKDQLSHREHIEPKSKTKTDKRSRRDARNKKHQYE